MCASHFFKKHSEATSDVCIKNWDIKITKFVRIGIADKNDSPPYFDRFLYETEIDENADLQTTVLTVNAKNHNDFVYLMFGL
ncbi:unnamed protein product [Ceratitis capitata]|uniref:(Mediterranean fruit fly) hypothetical protein n=1 Tax=Ceratitis capitata TaxID=7213 RepID=A0A811UK09_CERCA|nr:unnamed protein product [Ceratitis capitata]